MTANEARRHEEERAARALPRGIRARLFLLIALASLPVLLLLVGIAYQRYTDRRAQALQAEVEVAHGVATTFAAYLNDVRRTNYVVGQAIEELSPYSQAVATRLLAEAAAQYPTVRNLSWVSPEGTFLASSEPALVGRDLSSRRYYRQILAGEPWAIGDLTASGIAVPSPTVGLGTAIRDATGALRGIVVAGIEPMRLGELTLTQRRPAGGAYAIFDRQGTLVYRSPELPVTWEQRVRWRESDPVLRRALQTGQPERGITRLPVPGGEWISARVQVPGTEWVAGAGRPVDVALAPVRRDALRDAALAVLVLAIALLLASRVARTISVPLRRLEHDAEAMGAGEARTESDPLAPTEVERLRRTVAQMAADLVGQAEELREANRRKDEFLAMLSHELRNPLAAIAASVGMLQSIGGEGATARRAIEAADRQVWHMKRLIDDLLDVARITRGQVELRREVTALSSVLESAVQTSRPIIEAKGHTFTLSLPAAPLYVDGDATRLAQVFANLLDNAAKYTPAGGRIELSAELEGDEAAVHVRDNGIGIPADLLPRVFDLFTQGERSLGRTEGGLGIGLTMVRSLVEMHGGRVEARSEGAGQGSEFVVRLPLAPEAAVPRTPPHAPAPAHRRRRVLVVDDNADLAEMLVGILEVDGHEAAAAHDGPSALALAARVRPDVVLLDIGMPGMDGYEVARRLRQAEGGGETVVVAVTGYGQDEDRDRALASGFDAHLVKPVDLGALRQVVEGAAPPDP